MTSPGLVAARARVLELVRSRRPLLIVTDFDGTLSPISLDPLAAKIDPAGRRALRRLAALAERRPDRVSLVVLSGRAARDVAGRVRVGGVRYLGNHGIERTDLARRRRPEVLDVRVDPALEQYVEPATSIGDAVASALGRPDWLYVEPKGPAIAFHFRQAPDPDAARIAVIEAIEAAERAAGGTGLVQLEGRKVVELQPEGAGGKGGAVRRLIDRERPGAVIVLGDDRSDAEAFEAVRTARASGRIDGLTVGVQAASETPPEVAAAADVELANPNEASRLLAALASALQAEEAVGGSSRS